MDWESAGLLTGAPDRAVRIALLEHLAGLGYDVATMQAAHAQGRLYALEGDQGLRPGLPALSYDELAERLGQDVTWVRQLWRALGLTDSQGPVATVAEADGLAIWVSLLPLLGQEGTMALARVHGAGIARVAEATASTMTTVLPDIDLAHSGDELTTGHAFAAATSLLPEALRCIDVLYRHHLQSATFHFEATEARYRFDAGGTPYCIAFADLCGFTAATERMTASELSHLLEAFESASYDEAAVAGGRCVKLIGDAAMFAAASADVLADLVHRVLERMAEASGVLPVRVGMAAGSVVIRGGDYFGQPVNLAARLLSVATPGTVFADDTLVAQLAPGRWRTDRRDPVSVKGIAAPVTPWVLARAHGSPPSE